MTTRRLEDAVAFNNARGHRPHPARSWQTGWRCECGKTAEAKDGIIWCGRRPIGEVEHPDAPTGG